MGSREIRVSNHECTRLLGHLDYEDEETYKQQRGGGVSDRIQFEKFKMFEFFDVMEAGQEACSHRMQPLCKITHCKMNLK